jgi:transcriptional regulator with XRE-family HTH domain
VNGFSETLRDLRSRRGLSLRTLGRAVHYSGQYIWELEQGRKPPTPEAAAALDRALGADGALRELAERPPVNPLHVAARESAALSRLLDAGQPSDTAEELTAGTHHLAVAYLSQPATLMLDEAGQLRRAAVHALRAKRIRRPTDITDATLHIGHLSGVLAYAAVDLGDPRSALTHAEAAWQAADAAGDNQLRAWVRGTQSLVLRFAGDYPAALAHALDGLAYAHEGTARMRLLCGVAQCHANLGDARSARAALAAAETGREHAYGVDKIGGLFGFSEAKQAYYSGSSLIWLDTPDDAAHARDEARQAISAWSSGPVADRSLDDEALAHVYLATASLQLGDLEEAAGALEPILSLPPDRRISWIVKRLDRVVGMLAAPPFASDPGAVELRERIRDYR